MTTLAELNALRAAADMKPLKVWKASKAALAQAIAKLQSTITQQLEASKAITPLAAETTVKAADKLKAGEHKTIAEIAAELGINPKVARAKLRRRDDIPRLPGKQWTFASKDVAAVVAILQGDNRKKS